MVSKQLEKLVMYCPSCAGSGEGYAPGTRCSECKGIGEISFYAEDDEEDTKDTSDE